MSKVFNKKEWGIIAVMLVLVVVASFFTSVKIQQTNDRMYNIEQQLEERDKAEKQILNNLEEIKSQQEELQKLERQRLEKEKRHQVAVNNLVQKGFDRQTDLGANIELSAKDMDDIIDKWSTHMKNGTRFKGKGATFVEAAKETGLNPIYLMAHAALESSWGNSEMAQDRHNYYGINAVDNNPNRAYAMGDSVDEGIIAGAHWIKRNFYDHGYRTLEQMQAANYATDPSWEGNIEKIACASTQML